MKSLIALLVLAGGSTAYAAQPKADPDSTATAFEDLVEVSEVLLDVLVTDRKGNVVLGLGPEDFIVREEGRPVAVESVAFYSNRRYLGDVEAQGEAAPNEVLADRHIVLFFHNQRRVQVDATGYHRRFVEAGRDAKAWVGSEMLGGDWLAVVSYDVKLKVHTDFTRDRERLARAIDDAVVGRDPGNIWPSRRPDLVESSPTLLALLPEGKTLRRETKTVYDGLRLVADATRGAPGRKVLMLFTTGFGELEGLSPTTTVDPRYYPDMRKTLNDRNVAIYPIDLTPLHARSIQTSFLSRIASESGGTYFENFVNFRQPMSRIADENNGYYLLSYAASHPAGEDGYRRVEVAVGNPELHVRARRGYGYGD